MVTRRKRTVLTPQVPRATKPKAEPEETLRPASQPRPGERYRCRPTERNELGDVDKPIYSDSREELAAIQLGLVEFGQASVIERRSGPAWIPVDELPAVTVPMLATAHLATEHVSTIRKADNITRSETRWEISAEGLECIRSGRRP